MGTPFDAGRRGTPVSPYGGDLIVDNDLVKRIGSLPHRLRRFEISETRGRLWAIRSSLVAPLRAARVARNAVREFGKTSQEHIGVSIARQFFWVWWLNLRHLYDDTTVYCFQLFSRERAMPLPLYAPNSVAMLLYRSIMPLQSHEAAVILADKRRFASWCKERDISTPQILMEFEDGRISRNNLGDGLAPDYGLFAKWAAAYDGHDTHRWDWTGERWLDGDSRTWDFSAIVEFLAVHSKDGAVVLQPCLVNHSALRDLSPHALSTMRIMTTRRPREGPRFMAGVLRMGIGHSAADNFSQGGIASGIDFETGTLDVGVSLDRQNRTHEHVVHPDTGARIAGRQIPFWNEAIDLAIDAHSKLGEIPSVGWDVAVLEGGPTLLEGNWNMGFTMVQLATRTPLLVTEFARTYAAWLDEPECAFDDRWLFEHAGWSPLDKAPGEV